MSSDTAARESLIIALEEMSKGLDKNRPDGYLLGRLAESVELVISLLEGDDNEEIHTSVS